MRYAKVIPSLLALFFIAYSASAQDTLYWLGAVSTEWTEPDNWSETRGGLPALSASTASTAVILTSGNTYNCKLDANALAGSIDIEAGSQFDVDAYTLGVTNDFTQHGGTFYGRSSAIGIGGVLLIVDGDFNSTSGTLSIGGGIYEQNFESFLAGTGKVKITSSAEIDVLSFLYDLEVPSGVTATLGWHTPILNSLELGGTINTNSKTLYIDNPSSSAISGGGGIHVDVSQDMSLIIWRTAEQTGSYRIPLLSSLSGTPIPFDFNITVAGTGAEGRILLTMLAMDEEKPQVPFESIYYTDNTGGNNTDFNSHRFWMMLLNDYDVSPTITATFSYTDNDIAGASITESQLKAQSKIETGDWQTPTGTVDAMNNQVTVTGITGNSDEANIWTLVDNSSPNATPNKLYWLGEESAHWSDEYNWTYVEGSFTLTNRIPCATCTAIIPFGTDFDCVLDANAEVGSLEIRAGATFDVGTFDLDVAGSFVQHGGTFYGRSSAITVGEELLIVDGTFNSTTGNLVVSGSFQEQTPGSIDNHGGTLTAGGDLVLDIFSPLYRLVIPTGTKVTMGNFSSVSNSLEVDGILDLNAMGIGISNPNSNALKGTGGIYFDGGDDNGIVYWAIGEGTGTYSVPVLSTLNGPIIPLDIEVLTTGDGVEGGIMIMTAGFYDPEEAKPMNMIEGYPFTNQYGTDNSRMTANRIWAVGMGMFDVMPEITLDFGYDDVTLANTDIVEANLKVQSTDMVEPWSEPLGTVDIVNRKVTLVGNTWEDEVAQFFTLVDGTSPNSNIKALYWTGADDNDWSNADNWSRYPQGPSAGEVPGGLARVVLNEFSSTNLTVDQNVNINRLSIEPNWQGTVTLNNVDFVVEGEITIAGGTFLGGAANITTSSLILSGGTFQAPGELTLSNALFIESGTFNHNNGTLRLSSPEQQMKWLSMVPFYNVELVGPIQLRLERSLTVTGNLDLGDGNILVQNSELILSNPSSTSLQYDNGRIITNSNWLNSGIRWAVGTNTGTYTLPIANENQEDQTIVVEITEPGTLETISGFLEVNTFATDVSKTLLPEDLPYLFDNPEDVNTMVNRFWKVDFQGYSTNPLINVSATISSSDLAGTSINLASARSQAFGTEWSDALGGITNNVLTISGVRKLGDLTIHSKEPIIRRKPLILVTPVITDFDCDKQEFGTIFLQEDANAVYAPYQYHWSNGSTNQYATGLLPGNYTVTITASNGLQKVGSYNVGTNISLWNNVSNVNINTTGDEITAHTLDEGGGAFSCSSLNPNELGCLSFSIDPDYNGSFVVGLSEDFSNYELKNIEYGFYFTTQGVSIIHNGIVSQITSSLSSAHAHEFTICRYKGRIIYTYNGKSFVFDNPPITRLHAEVTVLASSGLPPSITDIKFSAKRCECDFTDVEGFSYNSFGAFTGVYGSNVALTIAGNIVNELDGNGIGGKFYNENEIYVQKEWINNGHNGMFVTGGGGKVYLYGTDQGIRGTSTTNFAHLILTRPFYKVGSGFDYNIVDDGNSNNVTTPFVKKLFVDATVTEKLELKFNELATQNFILFISNPTAGSLTRYSGATGGFVSNKFGGSLDWNVRPATIYNYYLGSRLGIGYYRPVEVYAANSTFTLSRLSIGFYVEDPLGYYQNLAHNVSDIYDDYFFHIKDNLAGDNEKYTLKFNYNSVTDGLNNNILHYDDQQFGSTGPKPIWKSTGIPAVGASLVAPNDRFITLNEWGDFDQPPFALGKAGFVIVTEGTGNWPDDNGNTNGSGTTWVINDVDPNTQNNIPEQNPDGSGLPPYPGGSGGTDGEVVTPEVFDGCYAITILGDNSPNGSNPGSADAAPGESNVELVITFCLDDDGGLTDIEVETPSGSAPLADDLFELIPGGISFNTDPKTEDVPCYDDVVISLKNPSASDDEVLVMNLQDGELFSITGYDPNDINSSITIFDALDNSVYSTSDLSLTWDGTINGNPATEGMYKYELVLGKKVNGSYQGTVTLKGQFLIQ